MKIVFIIDQVYLHGGIERVLSIKANYFAKRENYQTHIITTEQKGNNPCYNFDNNIIFYDLEINYHRTKSYFHPKNLKKIPTHIRKVKIILNKIDPNLVIVCSHSTDTYFMPFLLKNIPKVKEFHYSKNIEIKHRKNPKNIRKKYFLKFADFVERKYDRLVVLNQDEKKYYQSDNVTIIPNPLTFFPKEISKFNNKVVAAAGRVAPVKGFDILIEIWKEVVKENNDWKLHIYGTGEIDYINYLQKKIDDYNLNDFVILKDATNNIQKKFLDASIYAMTSHNECFPLVLLEAQACGLPIISFNCPHGPRNIVVKNSGKLVDLYDEKKFVEELNEMMNDNDTLIAMGKVARKNSLNYKVEKVMNSWENLFLELNKK